MAGNYGANQYKTTAVTTANRGQILLMLYEAAIRNTRRAMLALDKKDIAAKGVAIGKVHDIINELANTLDFEVGGTIAKDLERLYHYVIELLVKANIENSKQPLETVQKLLETLLEGWKVAVEQANITGTKSASEQK